MPRQRSLFFGLSNSWTRQDMTGKQRQFGPSALSHRHESTEGRKDVGELLMKNVFRKMLLKTCFRTCFFQSLCVTRHVPFMVWRDWPDWSDDSEVSTGGTRLDRRRKTAVPCAFGLWLLDNRKQTGVDGASAATCWTQRVKDICPGAANGNGEVALKEVASKPLSANLCK